MAQLGPADPAGLTVQVREEPPGIPVVELVGELDIANVVVLENALEPILEREPRRLVLDLSRLRFMDSSGIAVLLTAARRAAEIEVRNPSEILRRIIESMGLRDVLRVQP